MKHPNDKLTKKNEDLQKVKAEKDGMKIQMQHEFDGHASKLNDLLDKEEKKVANLKEQLDVKDGTVFELKNKITEDAATTKLMEENICQLRDENTKLRNNLKLCKQNNGESEGTKLRTVMHNFKKEIVAEIASLRKDTKTNLPSHSPLQFHSNNPQTTENSPDENGRTHTPVVPGHLSYSETAAPNSNIRSSSNNNSASISVPNNNTHGPNRSNASNNNNNNFDDEPTRDDTRNSNRIQQMRERRNNRESKTVIFSSSITRSINKNDINKECKKGKIVFHEFKGKKASDIVRYIDPHLMDEQPHSVMFIAGGNDLPNFDISAERIKSVAKCLIDGGLKCRNEFGVSDIFISSVLPRENCDFQINRYRLNNLLREMCLRNNFNFIENRGISLKSHILQDGVHLNKRGSNVLRANIIDSINDK